MKKILLLSMVFLSGCATKGSMTWSQPLPLEKIKCPKGRVIYPSMAFTTSYTQKTHEAELSWQCIGKGFNYRIYIPMSKIDYKNMPTGL